MNIRKGLTRIWIAGSCLWIALSAFAAYEQHKPKAVWIPVVAPDGTLVEFPAGMPVEEMRAAMARRFPPAEGSVATNRNLDPRQELHELRRLAGQDLQELRRLADLYPPQRWDAARIGAFLSAVLTNGVLPAALGYAGLFLLMWVTRWIVAGFKGT